MKAVALLAVLLFAHILVLVGHSIPRSPWTLVVFFWQDVLVVTVWAMLQAVIRRQWVSWMLYGAVVVYVAANVPLERTLSSPLTWTMARAARGPLSDSIWHYVTWPNGAYFAAVLAAAVMAPVWFGSDSSERTRGSWKGSIRFRACIGTMNHLKIDEVCDKVRDEGSRKASMGQKPHTLPTVNQQVDEVRDEGSWKALMRQKPHTLPTMNQQVDEVCDKVRDQGSWKVGKIWLLVSSLGVIALGVCGTGRIETLGLHRNPIIAILRSALPHIRARSMNRSWRTSFSEGSELNNHLTQWRSSCGGRNVILVLLESTAAGYLPLFGASRTGSGVNGRSNNDAPARTDPMPNLSQLAADSILFENAYAVYPESIKGLFSILCSQYPCFDSQPRDYAAVQAPSLAQVLGAQGYRTGLFHSGRFMYLGMESMVQNRGYATLEDAGDIGGNHQSSFGVDEPSTVKRILQWVDAQPAGQKFFLTYLPVAGHHPYEAPAGGPFTDTSDFGHYENALHYGDAALEELLCGLRARKLLDETLLVFCGDHGEAFGQHEGNYGHTLALYEENVHVPLLFVAPGMFHGQRRVKSPASLVDMAPTVLALLGLAIPLQAQGDSLLTDKAQMALFYTDYSLDLVGLRDGPWKFIHNLDSGRSTLFDLSCDPDESRNLATAWPGRCAAYRELLKEWSAAQKEHLQQMRKGKTAARRGETLSSRGGSFRAWKVARRCAPAVAGR